MSVEYEIRTGTSWREERSVYEGPPVISRVEIETWGGDEPIARGYPTLTAAERALQDAADAHLEAVGGRVEALVRVEWVDGASHRASIELDAATVASGRAFGLIKGHLMRQGVAFMASTDALRRAWGTEVRQRLANDKSDPDSVAEIEAWHASLAFIPSDGAAVPPIEAVVVAVGDDLEPLPDQPGDAWPTLAAADAAIARYVAARRRARRGGYAHVRVRWADGMQFRVWGSVATLAQRRLVLAEYMADHARYIASDTFAERNARTLPRRPLEPQRAWARELLRRVAPDGDRGAGGSS